MQYAAGSVQRVIPFRLSPGEDVFACLMEICEREQVSAGVVLTCVGSLDGVSFCDIEVLPEKKCGCGYGRVYSWDGLFELLSVSGIVGRDADGKVNLHLHYTFADREGRVFGGHMVEGNRVKMTVEGAIGAFDGVTMVISFRKEGNTNDEDFADQRNEP